MQNKMTVIMAELLLCSLGVQGQVYVPAPKPAPSKEVVAGYLKLNTNQRVIWGEKRREEIRKQLMGEINEIRTKIRNLHNTDVNSEKLVRNIATQLTFKSQPKETLFQIQRFKQPLKLEVSFD